MKVIGIVDSNKYIVEVDHNELEKVYDKYYGKMERLKVGQVVALSEGHDFRNDIRKSCSDMVDAMKSFDSKRLTLLKFAEMVTEKALNE